MTETPERKEWLVLLGLTVAGVLLGAGLRAGEPHAHASSLECDDTGKREGQRVELRRIEGDGAYADQEYWGDAVSLSLEDHTLSVFESVYNPARPPFKLNLEPEDVP